MWVLSMTEDVICKYCRCSSGSHPTFSFPLGSFTCSDCGECPLLEKDVIKLNKKD